MFLSSLERSSEADMAKGDTHWQAVARAASWSRQHEQRLSDPMWNVPREIQIIRQRIKRRDSQIASLPHHFRA
jgi:hypothetical protein